MTPGVKRVPADPKRVSNGCQARMGTEDLLASPVSPFAGGAEVVCVGPE